MAKLHYVSVMSLDGYIGDGHYDWSIPAEGKMRSAKDLCIGGPTLATQALRNNLVDEIHLFVVPTTIGNGIPVIPVLPKDIVLRLELIEERRFSEGWVYLHYRVQT